MSRSESELLSRERWARNATFAWALSEKCSYSCFWRIGMDNELSGKIWVFDRRKGEGASRARKSFTFCGPKSRHESGLFFFFILFFFFQILTSKFNQWCCYFRITVYKTSDIVECTYCKNPRLCLIHSGSGRGKMALLRSTLIEMLLFFFIFFFFEMTWRRYSISFWPNWSLVGFKVKPAACNA